MVLDGTFISLPGQSAKMCRPGSLGPGGGPKNAEEIDDILHAGLAKILGVEESKNLSDNKARSICYRFIDPCTSSRDDSA